MSYISFRRELVEAFLYGGIFSAAVFTTAYFIDKIHEHSDDLELLFKRVAECEEKQDLNESKERQDDYLKK